MTENIKRKFVKPGRGLTWNRNGVEEYMNQGASYREKLLMLMHITDGQPARAPELLSVRHSNTIKGNHRNIFVEDGLIVFVTRYHKGYTISEDVKIIHRYLPREVEELMVFYLWLVLPFQQRLEAAVWKKDEVSAYMWPTDPNGTKWTSERMRQVMKRESQIRMGIPVTIQAYREMIVAISRRWLGLSHGFQPDEGDVKEDGATQEEEEDEVMDLQAGHTAHVAGMIYGRGIMDQSGEIASKRQKFRRVSEMWHRFLRFESTAFDDSSQGEKRKVAPFEIEAEEFRMRRWKRLRDVEVEGELKRVMGPDSRFRGVQKPAMEAIMAGKSPVVVVMPTEGGKSLLFMLPAWCSRGGTTIVVVPLIALRQDMKQRCGGMSITCAEWNSRKPPDAADVMLVTPESAVSDGFRTFMNRLRATQVLNRIVIDECHVVLNDQPNFRRQMQELGELINVEAQMMLLTATLPPSKEKKLWRRMSFDETKVLLFRTSTVRSNVRYQVIKVQRDSRDEEKGRVVRMVEGKLKKIRDGKIVVYCNSVRKVKDLAEALDCDGYHHHAEEKGEKLKRFMSGEKRVIVATSALGLGIDIPDIRVIIHTEQPRSLLNYAQESGRAGRDGLPSQATVMWNEGTDGEDLGEMKWVKRFIGSGEDDRPPPCRRVVLNEYLDGREDREGCEDGEEWCDVCIGLSWVPDDHPVGSEPESMEEQDEGDERHLMLGDVEGEDGLSMREQQEYDAQRQDRLTIRVRRKGQIRDEDEEAKALLRPLNEVKRLCAVCTKNGSRFNVHPIYWCGEEDEAMPKYRKMKELIRKGKTMEDFGGCVRCFVPQAWCNRWEENPEDEGGWRMKKGEEKCKYTNVVLGWFLIFIKDEGFRDGLTARMREGGFNIEKSSEVLKYVGQRKKWGGLETWVLLQEFWQGVKDSK